MNSTEQYWNILQQVIDFVQYSETKAGVVITIYGVILTLIYSNANDTFDAIKGSYVILGLSVLCGIMAVFSVIFAFNCINPRLKNKNPSSIIYFGHIQAKFGNFEDYYNQSKATFSKEEEFEKHIAEQIHVNSKIAWKKFSNVTWSIRLFGVNMIILFIILIIYLL